MLSAGLLSMAIAPGIAIAVYIYKKDHTEKESKLHLFVAFLLGMAATLPAFLLSRLFEKKTGLNAQAYSIGTLLTYCIFGIGLIEELSKFLFSKIFLTILLETLLISNVHEVVFVSFLLMYSIWESIFLII